MLLLAFDAVLTLFHVEKICGIKFIESEIIRAKFNFFIGGKIFAKMFSKDSSASLISKTEVVSKITCANNVVIKNLIV